MKQIEVQIMGQGYLLSCPEGGEALMMQAVNKVDAAMCKIRDAGKVKARDRIAVLASLNLAFELSELQQQVRAQAEASAQRAAAPGPAASVPQVDLGDAAQQVMAELIGRIDRAMDTDGRLL